MGMSNQSEVLTQFESRSPASLHGRATTYSSVLSRLSRKTSSGRFIPEIDGLRFVAIALVVISRIRSTTDRIVMPVHQGWLEEAVAQGKYGVHLFFVISGFILALPFISHYLKGGPAVSLKSYYARRLTRLEPPYLLAISLFFFLRIAAHDPTFGFAEQWPHYLASAFYVHNILYHDGSTILAPAWSLEIEVQFYLLVPLLARLLNIANKMQRRTVILGLVLVTNVIQAFVLPKAAPLTLLNFLQYFLMGFLLADIYLIDWNETPIPFRFSDAVAISAFLVTFTHPMFSTTVWNAAFPFCILLFYYAAFRGKIVRKALVNPWISTTGGMCYTIYLFHAPILTFVAHAVKTLRIQSMFVSVTLLTILYLPILLVVSVSLFALVERPCMDKNWPAKLRLRLRGNG
jgi:peptidoglycan/LPS O-acetylase OafA/YrhL